MQKILQVWTRLPDEDGGRHAGDHLVPRTVELGQRDDLTQSGLVEAVQQLATLRTEEVDGPEFRVEDSSGQRFTKRHYNRLTLLERIYYGLYCCVSKNIDQ